VTASPLPPTTGALPATTSARRTTTDRALLAFFLLAYLLPWTVWCSQIAQESGWTGWHLPGGIALWTLVPVTVTATALTGGRAGLVALARRLVRWRVPARWYAAAVGLPLALATVATGIGAAASGAAHLGETLSLSAAVSYLLYGIGLFLLTEEAAWRGFALPRLMTRLSPLAAALVLGVVWAGWHLPTFLLGSESDSAIPYGGFTVLTVATSVITAWLYLGSGGSVLLCALFHAVVDAGYSWTGVVGADHSAFWAAVVLEVSVAAYLAVRRGSALRRTPTGVAR
jgi:membrane protease YdiL (CAAX protease family)